MRNKCTQTLARCAASVIVVVALQGAAAAAELQKVKMALGVRSIDEAYSPLPVAKYLGYFEAEGLDVTLLPVGGSNDAAVQVGAGNAELGMPSPGQVLVGIENGTLDVRYFYQVYYRNIWKVSVLPDSPIRELKDLRGKKLGVVALGSAGINYGRAYAKEAGLDPERDISFIQIGVGAQAMISVRQKLVDAIVFVDATVAKMDTLGLKLRDLPVPAKLEVLPDASLLAHNETIAKNPKMLVGAARAIAKGYDFTMANPAAAVMITWKLYPEGKPPGNDAQAILNGGITVNQARMANWNTPKTGAKHGIIFPEDWENLMEFLLGQGTIKKPLPPDKIYTNGFIDEINTYDRAAVIAQAKNFKLSDIK